MNKYRLKTPVAFVFHRPGGQKEPVTIPEGAVVDESLRHTYVGRKVGVYWDGRHYSVSI